MSIFDLASDVFTVYRARLAFRDRLANRQTTGFKVDPIAAPPCPLRAYLARAA
jgi:hypothetical protein